MLRTRSAVASALLWLISVAWVIAGQGDPHPNAHRLLLSAALGSTILMATDRNARQLAVVASLSYRAGAAARDRESRILSGDLPAEPRSYSR